MVVEMFLHSRMESVGPKEYCFERCPYYKQNWGKVWLFWSLSVKFLTDAVFYPPKRQDSGMVVPVFFDQKSRLDYLACPKSRICATLFLLLDTNIKNSKQG